MKPTFSLTLSLPKPCNEDWDKMTPVEKGRFCASCQKTVIDFSTMTDDEIIRIYKKAGDKPPCGNFHESQLDRELIPLKKPGLYRTVINRVAAAALLLQTITIAAVAQTAGKKHNTESGPGKGKKQQDVPITIAGTVADVQSNIPIPDLSISIVGTGWHSTTDSAGRFSFTLPSGYCDTITLRTTPPKMLNSRTTSHIADKVIYPADFGTSTNIRIYRTVEVIARDPIRIRRGGAMPKYRHISVRDLSVKDISKTTPQEGDGE